MFEDIGYIDLTLAQSDANVCVKVAHISMFYRKDEKPFTTVHLQGALDFLTVKEEPEEIGAKIRDIHPSNR